MKLKTARRFLARNKWKVIEGNCSPSFWKRSAKCKRIVAAGEDVIFRKFS